MANNIVAATADLALTINGRLAQKPDVGGRITIDLMDITVPDRFGGVSAPIPGTKQRQSDACRRRPPRHDRQSQIR